MVGENSPLYGSPDCDVGLWSPDSAEVLKATGIGTASTSAVLGEGMVEDGGDSGRDGVTMCCKDRRLSRGARGTKSGASMGSIFAPSAAKIRRAGGADAEEIVTASADAGTERDRGEADAPDAGD